MNRRNLLTLAAAAPLTNTCPLNAADRKLGKNLRFCLNTATIQGQNLPLDKQIEVACNAGYHGIEPWVRDVDKYRQSGRSLKDLAKKCQDSGLIVESAIGFPEWAVNDEGRRARSMETLKKDLEALRDLGCKRLAAPPAGATKSTDIPLVVAAERFGLLAKVVSQFGLVPMVEVWGFSTFLNHLGDASYIATECRQPSAILADIYHLYKGGSGFESLALFSGAAFQVFHVNDYPASPLPAEITDAHRVYPGDGVAPYESVISALAIHAPDCVLSLELFNREYWKQDALEVARTGLQKLKKVVAKSLKS